MPMMSRGKKEALEFVMGVSRFLTALCVFLVSAICDGPGLSGSIYHHAHRPYFGLVLAHPLLYL